VEAAKDVSPSSFTVLGGPHPSFLPIETLGECHMLDAVYIGEGEETEVELAEAVRGDRKLASVNGIAFTFKEDAQMETSPRPFIRS